DDVRHLKRLLSLHGRDLLLKLQADLPEKFLLVNWKINKTVTLVRFDPSGKPTVIHNVTGRVQSGENKFSVILKNVQEVDSGLYSAVAGTLEGDKLLTEYKVTVQVSPVELIVDRVDSSSSESCDLHVTCRTHNAHISSTFRCVDRVCIQGGRERPEVTTSGASLQVYLLHNVIICNHSNQVHWTQDFNTTEHFYPLPVWVIAVCTAALTLILIVVLSVWLCIDRRSRTCKSK
uniref:Immunoglobulin V-set domain-containing protein n=1 Tax=Gasterosteus aculeatus aculeatus TaxID=481459 RepID=G3Q0I3_GASAC